MTYSFTFLRLDDGLTLRDGVMSLKHFWRRSGGKWTRLKKLIVEHRGARCEKCGASGVTLDAHEIWEHVSAKRAGIEPKKIREVMKVHRDGFRKHDEVVQKRHLALGKPLPVSSKRRSRALVRALVDIMLLCQKCHRAEHSRDVDYSRDFIMESHYSGFDELPNYKTFKTFAEWEAAMKDGAELRDEDEKYYCRPYPEE